MMCTWLTKCATATMEMTLASRRLRSPVPARPGSGSLVDDIDAQRADPGDLDLEPVAGLHPERRLAAQPDAVGAFQHDIDKLMSYASADQDWRADSGWPSAALALHGLITGNMASGQKACDVYLPHFTGESKHNQGSDLYYALAYDWLFHHPCFTDARKADLRAKLIAWSDATATGDEERLHLRDAAGRRPGAGADAELHDGVVAVGRRRG